MKLVDILYEFNPTDYFNYLYINQLYLKPFTYQENELLEKELLSFVVNQQDNIVEYEVNLASYLNKLENEYKVDYLLHHISLFSNGENSDLMINGILKNNLTSILINYPVTIESMRERLGMNYLKILPTECLLYLTTDTKDYSHIEYYTEKRYWECIDKLIQHRQTSAKNVIVPNRKHDYNKIFLQPSYCVPFTSKLFYEYIKTACKTLDTLTRYDYSSDTIIIIVDILVSDNQILSNKFLPSENKKTYSLIIKHLLVEFPNLMFHTNNYGEDSITITMHSLSQTQKDKYYFNNYIQFKENPVFHTLFIPCSYLQTNLLMVDYTKKYALASYFFKGEFDRNFKNQEYYKNYLKETKDLKNKLNIHYVNYHFKQGNDILY